MTPRRSDNDAWKETVDSLDAAIKSVRDMVSSLRLDGDARRGTEDKILAAIRRNSTTTETNLNDTFYDIRDLAAIRAASSGHALNFPGF